VSSSKSTFVVHITGMDIITTELTEKIASAVRRASYIPTYLREDAQSYVVLAILDGASKGKNLDAITSSVAIKRRIVDYSRQEQSLSSSVTIRRKEQAIAEETRWQEESTSTDQTRAVHSSHRTSEWQCDDDTDSSILSSDMGQVMSDLLLDGTLQPKDVEMLSMRYRDDLSLREIADKYDASVQWVSKRLDAIRSILRESAEMQALVNA
jgi:RNA polymerase sigma factor (sigma-70 family)